MSISELDSFYQQHIASLSRADQLQLASRILSAEVEKQSLNVDEQNAPEIVRQQKEGLRGLRGILSGGALGCIDSTR